MYFIVMCTGYNLTDNKQKHLYNYIHRTVILCYLFFSADSPCDQPRPVKNRSVSCFADFEPVRLDVFDQHNCNVTLVLYNSSLINKKLKLSG